MKKRKTIGNPKQRGEWAEMRFMAQAAEHGLKINKPWGDSAQYDFVVGSGRNMVRVQVKSTMARCGAGYACSAKSNNLGYKPDDFDFLAGYVIPEDVWYVIPEPVIRGLGSVYLDPESDRLKYSQYKEAWDLLKKATQVEEETEAVAQPVVTTPMHKALLHMAGEMRKIKARHTAHSRWAHGIGVEEKKEDSPGAAVTDAATDGPE
jgi:hypothetical protein